MDAIERPAIRHVWKTETARRKGPRIVQPGALRASIRMSLPTSVKIKLIHFFCSIQSVSSVLVNLFFFWFMIDSDELDWNGYEVACDQGTYCIDCFVLRD